MKRPLEPGDLVGFYAHEFGGSAFRPSREVFMRAQVLATYPGRVVVKVVADGVCFELPPDRVVRFIPPPFPRSGPVSAQDDDPLPP